jgi:hypothetical protein
MNSLGDVIVESLENFLSSLFEPVLRFLQNQGETVLDLIVSTPRPDAVFTQPTNGPWPAIYDYYWDTIVPLALLLWAVSIGLMILLESTSHLFSSYHRSKLKKRAFSGLVGILSWWWIGALSLRFIDELASLLLPNLADLSLFDVGSFGAMGVLGLVVSATIDLALFLLIALLYYVRQVMLYLFVLLMPILIAFWVPGVGPLTLLSRFVQRLAGFYVPFLFMTIPVALLFKVSELLGTSASLSLGGIGQWLVAITTPFVAVAVPFVLFWQAGALFFMAERVSHHTSRQRARERYERARAAGGTTRQAQRNFRRGVRGEPAVRSDGQAVFDSGGSRAHAGGARLASTGHSLRQRLTPERNAGPSWQSASGSVADRWDRTKPPTSERQADPRNTVSRDRTATDEVPDRNDV